MNNASIGLLAFSLLSAPAFAEPQTETPVEPQAQNTAESQAVTPVETTEQQNTRLYVGLDVFKGETNYEETIDDFSYSKDIDLDQDGFRLKFGAELENNWRLQGYFKSEDVELFDENIYGIGIDLIKAFQATDKFYPFIQVGAGLDWMELKNEFDIAFSDDEISALALKFGVGATYKITNTIEVLGGIDWQYRTWDDIDVIEVYYPFIYEYTVETEDTSQTMYLGLNIFF